MKDIYVDNPKLRLRHMQAFAERLRSKHILGEEDPEFRKELIWVLECTNREIEKAKAIMFMQELGV